MTTKTYDTEPVDKLFNVVKEKGLYTKSLDEFKAKYNNPESIDNLYNVVSKTQLYTKSKGDFYNQYFPPVEKKSQVGGVDTKLNGGGLQLKEGSMDDIKAFVTGRPIEEIKANRQANLKPPAKITNDITQTKSNKPSEKSVKEEAAHKITQIADKDLTDPIKGINKLSQANPTNPKDILATEKAKEMLVGRMAQDGFDAKELLSRSFFGGAADDNQTSKILREKAADYDKSVASLRNIQVDDLTNATPEYLDNALTPQIKNAAIQYGAQKDPQFAKELQVIGLDLNDPDLFGKVGSFKSGQWTERFLQDENVGAFLSKENPNLIPAIDRAYKQIRVDNQDYGVNSVANEVSQAVQKSGFNNIDPVFNFYGDNHKAYADQVARDLYKDDPQSLAIWDKYIKDDQEKYMDAPSLMQGFAEGGEGVFKGIANTFTEPFRNASESTKRRWDKEALNISADPEGVFKIIRETGRVGGLVAAISGTGNVLGAGGTGMYAQKIVPALSGGVLPFFGDSLEEGRAKYPDSPVKAGLSALVNTTMYAALSQQLFPAKSINQALGKVSPDINNIVERLASGQISREAARQQANTAFKRALDFTLGATGKAGKITAELTAITQFNKGLDKIMMDEEEFKNYHPERDESEETITLFLSNIALGGFSKFGDMKKRNRVAEESYYELASNQKKYERMIDNLSVNKSFGTIQEFKENLKFISGIKTELDALRINPKDQKRFIFEALKEKSAKETSESAVDSSVQQKNKDVIKQAKEVKEKILAGEDAETIVTESQQKEIDKQKDTQLNIERLTIDNELDNKKYDKQREGLDGRNPEDKIKIEKIEEDRRRANEDFKIEMDKLSPTPKLPGIYGELYKSNPEAVLKDIAEQVQGVDSNGNPLEGGSRREDMIKQGFSEEIINEAIKKYPATPKETQASEGSAENVVPSTLKDEISKPIELEPTLPEGYGQQNEIQKSISKINEALAGKPLPKETVDERLKRLGDEAKDKSNSDIEAQRKAQVLIDGVQPELKDFTEKYNGWILGENEKPEINTAEEGNVGKILRLTYSGLSDKEMKEQLKEFGKAYAFYGSSLPTSKNAIDPILFSEQKPSPTNETKPEDTKDTFQAEKESPINAEPNKEGSGAGEDREGKPPISETPKSGAYAEEKPFTLIKDELRRVREEMGLDKFEGESVSNLEAITKAQRTVSEWKEKGIYEKEIKKVIDDAMTEKISDEGQNVLAQYIADLRVNAKSIKDRNSPEYNEALSKLNKAVEAGDVLRSAAGRILGRNTLKMRGEKFESVLDVELDMMKDFDVNELTPEQKVEAEKRFNDLNAKFEKEEQLRKEAEVQVANLKAEIEVLKAKKESGTRRKKTDEEYKKERTDLIKSIKDKWNNAGKDILSSDIPYRKQLAAIAPDVTRLIANYIEYGAIKTLEGVRKALKKDLSDSGININDEDVRSLIAGEFNEKKYTRNEIVAKVQTLRTEEKLLLQLESLERGEIPTNPKKKIVRNQRLKEIRDKIDELHRRNKLGRYSEDAQPTDQQKFERTIKQQIAANKNKQQELIEKINKKDFNDEKKDASILENKELQEKNKKLYDQYLQSVVDKEKAIFDYEKKRLDDKIKNHSVVEKIGDYVDMGLTTAKGAVAMFDQSGLLVQMLPATLSHPWVATRNLPSAIRDLFDNRWFDRRMAKLKNSKKWDIIEKSELALYDPQGFGEDVRNELLGGRKNLLNKDITIKGVKTSIGKAFERSTSNLFNNMRLFLFDSAIDKLYAQNKTFESHPEEFKSAARAINEWTGHGKVQKNIAQASPVLNKIIWSPKMMASTFNILGLGDIVRPVSTAKEIGKALGIKNLKDNPEATKGFYSSLTSKQRAFMRWEILRALSTVAVIMIAGKLTGATDDEDLDPLSPGFGTITVGDKDISLLGRFGRTTSTIAQVVTGKRHLDGKTDELGDTYGDKNAWDVLWGSQGRGKMTPAAGLAHDLILNKQKNYYTKEDITPLGAVKQMVVPLSFQDMVKDFSRDSALKAIFTTLLKLYGGNVKDQRDFVKKSSSTDTKKESKSKRTNQRKQTKQD